MKLRFSSPPLPPPLPEPLWTSTLVFNAACAVLVSFVVLKTVGRALARRVGLVDTLEPAKGRCARTHP